VAEEVFICKFGGGGMIFKYAIHPGYITSMTDGDPHYIGEHKLIKLYKLDYKECLRFDHPFVLNDRSKFIHLWPRYRGDYEQALLEAQLNHDQP